MDYELRLVVEKVAVSSQEVVQRDTITSYALQCPTSIGELGLRHAEQIDLLAQVQNIVLAEQSVLLDLGTPAFYLAQRVEKLTTKIWLMLNFGDVERSVGRSVHL